MCPPALSYLDRRTASDRRTLVSACGKPPPQLPPFNGPNVPSDGQRSPDHQTLVHGFPPARDRQSERPLPAEEPDDVRLAPISEVGFPTETRRSTMGLNESGEASPVRRADGPNRVGSFEAGSDNGS